MTRSILLVSLALAMAPGIAAADDVKDTEEVVVRERKSVRELRLELQQVEDKMYEVFNRLNQDDDYDIECRKIRRIGSQIPVSTCKAKLYWQSLERAYENNENDESAYEVDSVTNPGMHEEILRQKMLRMAVDEPQFLEVLKERKRLAVLLRQRAEKE